MHRFFLNKQNFLLNGFHSNIFIPEECTHRLWLSMRITRSNVRAAAVIALARLPPIRYHRVQRFPGNIPDNIDINAYGPPPTASIKQYYENVYC